MRVKIWGARGSIPTPIRPEAIKEKIISAMLEISNIADSAFKEELISAVLAQPQPTAQTTDASTPAKSDEAYLNTQAERRKVVSAYVDSLSPLLAGTAGGNTPCIEIRSGQDLFIIDAGSGIRELGLELMQGVCGQGKGVIHLLFSHPHWDHIQGFPFFRPAFIPGNRIFIYSVHDMETALRRQQESISFPISLDYMQAEMTFIPLTPEATLEFGDLRIRCLRTHHPGDAYAFRFEKGNKAFVYASDAAYPAGIDLRPYLNFFAEADVLIYDAQFTQRESDEKEDWGHSSSFVGVEMAQQAGVKNLVLYHYDPTYTDQDLKKILEGTLKFQENQYPNQEPVKVMIAQEGQTFDLTPTHLTQLKQVPGSKAAILKPSRILDERTVIELREQLVEMKKSNGSLQLIIDMSGVEMLQVTGLRALVKLKKESPETMMALAGPTTNVQQVIELAGYADFFAVYPSVHAALSKLQAHETLNLPGQMIKNRYYIDSKMGDGRLGTVFKATDTRLNRTVAIKILSPSFSEGAIEQFLQHGRQIVDLDHPNIVNVYDCDQDHGLYFMVEELVESKTLRDIIDEHSGQPLPFYTAIAIGESIARALEYAHAHGVIHGDLKPKNVLLAKKVAISDFGLGRLESGKSLLNEAPLALVTPHYLAPEQILGHPIDARTDLYALGIILYELFTGQLPFEGTDKEVLEYHCSSVPLPPRDLNPAISYSLEHLILKLLDKDPNKRYATARQARQILASMTAITSGDRQPRLLTHHSRFPLIGRVETLQQLVDLWKETQQGQGQLVFITGESGTGKTRLVQELAQQINQGTLLIGRCQKMDGVKGYQPFVEALNSYLASLPTITSTPEARFDNPVGRVLTQLVHHIPEIQRLLPDTISQIVATLPQDDRQNPETTTLAQSLAQATAKRPWLLILDDLHWGDQGSLKLLHYLACHCAHMALMIVGIYSTNEATDNKYLTEIVDSLKRKISFSHIALNPFSDNEVTQMLHNIWSQTVPSDLAAAITRCSKGNPLHVEEIARTLMDENVVSWRDNKWHFGPIIEASLPRHVHEAVLRRINRLPKETRALLFQAAILGPSFTFADLHEMSTLSGKDPLESLNIALERQLIRQAPRETKLYFSHVEIQEALYKNLSPLKRRVMHREAGEALERRYLSDLESVAEKLAYHFFQAGELEKGLIYCIQAAVQAQALYDNRNALAWYTQGLEALDQLGADYKIQHQQFELLLAREQIYNCLGNRQAQVADLGTLASLAQTFNDPARLAAVHNRCAAFNRVTNRLNQAMSDAEAGLAAAQEAKDSSLEGENLLQLAHIAANRGQLEIARQHLQVAQKIFRKTGSQDGEARSLNGLALINRNLNDYAQAQSYCQQALTLNQAGGNRHSQAASLKNQGILSLDIGSYTNAMTHFQRALEINWIIGDRRGEAICLNYLAVTYKELGNLEKAQNYLEKALSIRYIIEDQRGQAEDLTVLGTIHLAKGDYLTARDHIGEALEIFQRLGLRLQEGDTWLELGLAQESLGDLVRASIAYKQAQTIQHKVSSKASDLDARAGLARCFLSEGKTNKAKQEIETCLTKLKSYGTAGVKHPIRLYLTAYWVLQAANDKAKAIATLQEGCDFLKKRASTIDNPDMRALFIEKVPENKELSTQLKQHETE